MKTLDLVGEGWCRVDGTIHPPDAILSSRRCLQFFSILQRRLDESRLLPYQHRRNLLNFEDAVLVLVCLGKVYLDRVQAFVQ